MSRNLYPPTTFTVTNDHLTLLRNAYLGWCDDEYGAPDIDPKRPYGNSDVAYDIARHLGWEYDEDDGLTNEQQERAYAIHRETETVLQIALVTGEFKTGTYRQAATYDRRSWKLIAPGGTAQEHQ